MCERRHLREQLRLDVLTRDQQLDRLDAGRSFNQVFPLDREQP
jgi:hypothetical protein